MKIKPKLLLLIIPLVTLLGWLYIRSTPQYSLYQIRRAVKNHDYEMFTKYVDVDAVADSVFEQSLADQKSEEDKASTNVWEEMGRSLAEGLIISMKPALKESAKAAIRKAVESGDFGGKKLLNDPVKSISEIKVKKEGKLAQVTITDEEGSAVKLTMRKKESYWQLISGFDLIKSEKSASSETTIIPTPTPAVVTAKFGDRMEIGQGWVLTINQPEDFTPASAWDKPAQSKRFVTIDVVYENTSSERDSFSVSNFRLKDEEDHAYSGEYSGKEPKLESGDLGPGETIRGFITFEILEDVKVKSVVYSGRYKTIVFGDAD